MIDIAKIKKGDKVHYLPSHYRNSVPIFEKDGIGIVGYEDKWENGIVKEVLWLSREYYEKYPEEKYNVTYSEEVQEKFREAIKILRKAHIYVQRIDWYLSGDDGEDNFLSRLKEELEECK